MRHVPVDNRGEKVQGYQRACPLIGEVRESRERGPRVRLTMWSAGERAGRESCRDGGLREEEVESGVVVLRLAGSSSVGDIPAVVVGESGEEGACGCRLDGFSGEVLVDSPSAWVPAGGHLHDNAVGVLGLSLGDLDGGSDGRHVDGWGFLFCVKKMCVCVWVRREGKSEFGTRWTAFLYFFRRRYLARLGPCRRLAKGSSLPLQAGRNGDGLQWALTEFQLSPPWCSLTRTKQEQGKAVIPTMRDGC